MLAFIDTETRSSTPITFGTSRYLATAEMILATYGIGSDVVRVWEPLEDGMPADLTKAVADPDCIFVAHNGWFDYQVLDKHGIYIPMYRRRCTMAQALAHSLPASLEGVGTATGIRTDARKLDTGKRLISIFCIPNKAGEYNDRHSHPAEWDEFKTYAMRDADALRQVYLKLPRWNYEGRELALWHLDQEINARGFKVDLQLAQAASEGERFLKQALSDSAYNMTDGEVASTNQRDALLKYLLEEQGVQLPDMRAATLERRISDPDLPEVARELLRARLGSSLTSTKKFAAILKAVSEDGRLRGTLQFCGAGRTGRWAGRIFQPQNMPRPTTKIYEDIEAALNLIRDGRWAEVPEPLEMMQNVIRGLIICEKGNKLVVSDLSNIEGRGLAWICGEEWKLQAFKDADDLVGPEIYNLAYARAFNVSVESVDSFQRQLGKVMELALGYGGGVGAFVSMVLTYKIDLDAMTDAVLPTLPPDVLAAAMKFWGKSFERGKTYGLSERVFVACDGLKRMWRSANAKIMEFQYELEGAFRYQILHPDGVQFVGPLVLDTKGSYTRIHLPSGRTLNYPRARIVGDDLKIQFRGVNPYTFQWNWISTYSGKLIENVTQAFSRDVLGENMPAIDWQFPIVLTTHDEVVCETPDDPGYTHEALSVLLATVPEWAPGLPLAAKGFETYRYRKD